RRSTQPPGRRALSRGGDGLPRRTGQAPLGSRRTVGRPRRCRRLLAFRLRLAGFRGAPERHRTVQHHDRRPADSFPASTLPAAGRRAAPADARLAGQHRRIRPSRRRTGGTDRGGSTGVPCRGAVPARIRFQWQPSTTGCGVGAIAGASVELKNSFSYDEFLAHGGERGGVVTTVLGGLFPERVIGIHSTLAQAPTGLSTDGLTDQERAWADGTRDFWRDRAAYAKQQSTRPQTIGYSLVDSPVGLLAWIFDKFAEWTDTEDTPFERISVDRILDDVTLYWLTRSGASAARIYYESHGGVNTVDPRLTVDVPAAITIYPRDIEKCPRPWAEQRYRQIVRWATPEAGGHFPSLEVPDLFVG